MSSGEMKELQSIVITLATLWEIGSLHGNAPRAIST
jgi:hypothetical protein